MSTPAVLPYKEKVIKKDFYIYPSHADTLHVIADETHETPSFILRGILDRYFESYLLRNGMYQCQSCGKVQVKEEGKCKKCNAKWRSETFYCQGRGCGKVCRNKERHEVPVGNEVFIFGDCCFFSGNYKVTIREML